MNARQRRTFQRAWERVSRRLNEVSLKEHAARVNADFVEFCKKEGIPLKKLDF